LRGEKEKKKRKNQFIPIIRARQNVMQKEKKKKKKGRQRVFRDKCHGRFQALCQAGRGKDVAPRPFSHSHSTAQLHAAHYKFKPFLPTQPLKSPLEGGRWC
jgi:hypothetical protein